MKIKLICPEKEQKEIRIKLKDKVTFTDDGDYILIDRKIYENKYKTIIGYYNESYSMLDQKDIIFFEADKDSVFAYTCDKTYLVKEKLYELELKCMDQFFLRVHKSYIVNIKMIKKITPHINRKFILTMENDFKIDVTRTYYESFKDKIGL